MWNPAIAIIRSLHKTDPGKRHMKANDEELIGHNHLENAFTGCRRHFLVVIDIKMDVGPLY